MKVDATPAPAVGKVPLSQLRFGHEAAVKMNARVANRDAGIEQLADSIERLGLVIPLVVRKEGGLYHVIDGNRRLAALRLRLARHGDKDMLVPVFERPPGSGAAIELSLVANSGLPLHPVDRFEAFQVLADEGYAPEKIAERFGITLKEVRQALALAAIAPEVRDAWRAGEIGAETAQVFTMEPDLKRQAKVFAKLKKDGTVNSYRAREELVGEKDQAGALLAFVGLDAYRAAGGEVVEDLFGTRHAVSDAALAKRLADEKLAAKAAELVADDWSWAVPESEAGDRRWSWARVRVDGKPSKDQKARLKELNDKLDAFDDMEDDAGDPDERDRVADEIETIEETITLRSYAPEQKKRSGCVLSIDREGRLKIDPGLILPKAAEQLKATGAGEKAKPGKKPAKAGIVSNALMHRLSVALTLAAQDALAKDVSLGLPALLAGLAANAGPVTLRHDGHSEKLTGRKVGNFPTILHDLRGKYPATLAGLAARAAAETVNMVVNHASHPPLKDKAIAALCDAIAAEEMNAALRHRFDAKDYFDGVSKATCLAAIKEMNVKAAPSAGLASKPKGEIVKVAAVWAKETGWLPPELRTANYGPGSGKKAPAKKKGARR